MSTARVLPALNFLTGKGVNYYPDNCDGMEFEALIADYFSSQVLMMTTAARNVTSGMKVNYKFT